MSVLFCLECLVSLVSSISFGSYNISASSSEYHPETWWKGFDEGFSLKISFFKVSLILCTLPSYESLYFSPSNEREAALYSCISIHCNIKINNVWGWRFSSVGSVLSFEKNKITMDGGHTCKYSLGKAEGGYQSQLC